MAQAPQLSAHRSFALDTSFHPTSKLLDPRMNSNEDLPPEDSDVAFNTFIGVLVSVCGNASTAATEKKRTLSHSPNMMPTGLDICCTEPTETSSKHIFK